MKKVDPMYISTCCKAPMNTDNEGVTHWFICTECHQKCFLTKEEKKNANTGYFIIPPSVLIEEDICNATLDHHLLPYEIVDIKLDSIIKVLDKLAELQASNPPQDE